MTKHQHGDAASGESRKNVQVSKGSIWGVWDVCGGTGDGHKCQITQSSLVSVSREDITNDSLSINSNLSLVLRLPFVTEFVPFGACSSP